MASKIIPKAAQNGEATSAFETKKVLFRVRVPNLSTDETVCLVGNLPELGSWHPEKSIPLVQREGENQIWSKTVELPILNNTPVEFRYFICIILEPGTRVIVKNWETFLRPRIVYIDDLKSSICEDEYHVYGVNNDSIQQISRGWLTSEIIVHIKLLNNSLNLWSSKYAGKRLHIRVTPVDLRELNNVMPEKPEDSLSFQDGPNSGSLSTFAYTEVASLLSEDPRFHTQDQFGTELNFEDDGNVLVFQNVVLFPQVTAFLIDLYSMENSRRHLGSGYLLPSVLQSSEGTAVVPISKTSDHLPLGELTLNYLVIRPLANSNEIFDMSTTYARYWKTTTAGLDVGHRGSGSSFTKKAQNCAEVRENTVASFKNAIHHGADFIEFDVQLSKDLVPVIYHDFNVCICTKRKKNLDDSIDVLQLAVKDLTEEQLKMLKILHVSEGKSLNQKFFDEDLEDHQPFPRLQQLLDTLDPYVGFNVEIKRPMKRSNGANIDESGYATRTDLNLYLDTILEVLLRYAGSRRIVFSCFDPDVCISLRMKQNKYPVMLLTIGESLEFPKILADPRTWTLRAAVNCAKMFEILGICTHINILLRFPLMVHFTINCGLVLFCWGDETADPAVIKQMKKLGIHGVIYDKIHQHSEKAVKESIFLVRAREKQKSFVDLNMDTKL